MPEIEPKKIAFVLDTKASPESVVRYVLTSAGTHHDRWRVWNPRGVWHKAKRQRRKNYANALFVLFSHAVCEIHRCSQTKPAEIARPPKTFRIGRESKTCWPWANHVFLRIKDHERYKSLPSDLLRGLAPLLQATGKGGTGGDPKIEISPHCVDSVRFWDVTSTDLAPEALDTHAEDNTPIRLSVKEPTHVDIGIAYALSERIPPLERPETWLDLYRRLAIQSEYSASGRWIETTANPVEPAATRRTSPPQTGVTLQQVISKNNNVLLTGVSGSGKTTALRRLNNALCIEESPPGEEHLPIYIKLKEYEPILIRSIESHNVVDITALFGKVISATIWNNSTIQELHDSQIVRALVQKWCQLDNHLLPSQEDVLNAVSREASMWFEAEGRQCPQVVLLLDGINELQPAVREALKKALAPLVRSRCKILISCRSNLAGQSIPEPRERMREFELQAPAESDIISHLDHAVPGRGNELFATKIRADDKVLSLAKNLFFLSRFVETLLEDVNARLSSFRAGAAHRLVLACIRKKDEECAEISDKKRQDLLFSVLPYVAKWVIETTAWPASEAPSPSVFSDEFVGSRFSATEVQEALEYAEACGLLTSLGLLTDQHSWVGNPIFIHEFVRDYFAAHYLLVQHRFARIPHLSNILEYLEWDGALEMYFGLIQDPAHLQEDLATLAKWDVFLASRCLACCPVADESRAQQLLQTFSSSRFQRLYRDNEFPPHAFDICTALSHVLSLLAPETLRNRYLDISTPNHVRDAIPAALVLALGQEAFPYLKDFVNTLDLLDCEPAYMALQELGTGAAWQLLITKYIEFAQHPADNKHMVVQVCIFAPFRGISPDFILEQVAIARRRVNAHDYGEIHAYGVVRTISCALANVGPKYSSDLLRLEKHSDSTVSQQASEALLKMKHPKALHATLERVRHAKEFPSPAFGHLTHDLRPLCELGDPAINAELWQLFEKNLVPHSQMEWSRIPYELALRTDRNTLERLIRRCLSLNSGHALESLKAFASRVPDVVLPILLEQFPGTREGTPEQHRLIALRACCGDPEVKAQLLDMLANIEQIRWKTETKNVSEEREASCRLCEDGVMEKDVAEWEEILDRMDMATLDIQFQALVVEAVAKSRIPEALPILREISKKDKMGLPRAYALDALLENAYRQAPTRRQAAGMVESMVARHSRADSPTFGDYRLVQYVATWPPETLQYFLRELRDRVEVAIHRKRSSVVRIYTFIAQIRDILRQRHLELFKNWPCSPPIGGKVASSAKGKKTGRKRS